MLFKSFTDDSVCFDYVFVVYIGSLSELCKIHVFQIILICQIVSMLESDILLNWHDDDEKIKARNAVWNQSDMSS